MKHENRLDIYMGLPGKGKTSFAARLAQIYIQKLKMPVWSNVDIKDTYLLDCKKDLFKYDIRNGLVIIDEAGLEFDSRNFKEFTRDQTMFFKLYRHANLRIAVLSQSWDDVDIKIRKLAKNVYFIDKAFTKHLTKIIRLNKQLIINKEGQIVTGFKEEGLIQGTRYAWTSKAWGTFDTHDMPPMPSKEWPKW